MAEQSSQQAVVQGAGAAGANMVLRSVRVLARIWLG
ncbi:hypothetical protein [Enterobacter phage 03_vB_Eclo_IJM]|nr:hypothetical protein [Enterobacter phage 03_vB_Eclo_IJM]